MKTNNNPTTDSPRVFLLFLILAVLLGGYLRLSPGISASFPLNDGGLFFTMTEDLVKNEFTLPIHTTYNHARIPFAYPPFGFYLTGITGVITGVDILELFRLIPGIISTLTILAFVFLARDLCDNDFQAGISTLIFALLPSSFNWQIMGGGITRAPGLLFSLLALHFVYRMYHHGKNKEVILSILFCSLTVLSHPESAFHLFVSIPVFFFFISRDTVGIKNSFILLIGTLLLTFPWWVSVISNHGIGTLGAAMKSGLNGLWWLLNLINFDFSDEYYVHSISFLALIGVFLLSSRRSYFLPILFLIGFFTAPRSATRSLAPLIAVLAGYALTTLFSMLNRSRHEGMEDKPVGLVFGRIEKVFLGVLIVQWTVSSFMVISTISTKLTIQKAELQSYVWVSKETNPDSIFLVITGKNPLMDPYVEWFPTMTERKNISTIFGYEWVEKINFAQELEKVRKLQDCADRSNVCLLDWVSTNEAKFDYLVIRTEVGIQDADNNPYNSALIEAIGVIDSYTPVFEEPGISIFRKSN